MDTLDKIDSEETHDAGAPDYPYIAFEGEGRQIGYEKQIKNEKGEIEESGKKEGRLRQVYYLRVTGEDALEQADNMRMHKNFAVVGYGNLDKLKPEMCRIVEPKIARLLNSPEAQRAARLAEVKAPSKKGRKVEAAGEEKTPE